MSLVMKDIKKNKNFRKFGSFKLRYFRSIEQGIKKKKYFFLNSFNYENLNPNKTELSKKIT